MANPNPKIIIIIIIIITIWYLNVIQNNWMNDAYFIFLLLSQVIVEQRLLLVAFLPYLGWYLHLKLFSKQTSIATISFFAIFVKALLAYLSGGDESVPINKILFTPSRCAQNFALFSSSSSESEDNNSSSSLIMSVLSEIVPRVGLLVRSIARRGWSVGWLMVELDSVVSTTEQVASSTDEESNGLGIAEKGMIEW